MKTKDPVEYYISQLSEENYYFPKKLLDDEIIIKLNSYIKRKDAFLLSSLYKKISTFDLFVDIDENIKNRKGIINEDDKKLLKIITSMNKIKIQNVFEMLGSLVYISELIKKVKKQRNKTIIISLNLWLYLLISELLTKYFSEIIKEEIINKNLQRTKFIKKFNNGKHPEIGILIDEIEFSFKNQNIIYNKEELIFQKLKNMRNLIAHGNIFYDSKEQLLITSEGTKYSFNEFKENTSYLLEFLYEYISIYFNKGLNSEFKTLCRNISTLFHKIERDPNRKKLFVSHLEKDMNDMKIKMKIFEK
jgi:hypothetical protein